MLHKYLDMLQKAAESFSHLGRTDASWMDYFRTVEYELFLIAAGILILVAIAALLLIPTFGINKIIVKVKTVRENCDKRIQEYDDFVIAYHRHISVYDDNNKKENFGYNYVYGKDESILKQNYEWLVNKCKKYDLSYPEKKNECSYSQTILKFQELPHSKSLKDFNIKPEQLGKFADVFDCMKKRVTIIAKGIAVGISLLLFYAVFAVPFVLMFIH